MLGSAPADEAAIGSVMSSYEVALNASNTDAVMPLYAEDGVFMAPNNQSAIGKAAVRRPYDAVFKAIMLKVKFTIAELVVISPQWAYVRTNSAGTQKVNATGATSSEANQELFTTAGGRSPATAFLPPIRCKAVDAMDALAGACQRFDAICLNRERQLPKR